MSIYAQFDNGEQRQFASNKGWSDVIAWGESLSVDQFPEIAHLCDHGYEQQLYALEAQLSTAVAASPPPEDVVATINNLLDALALRGDADALFITDGMTSAEDEAEGTAPPEASNA
jgi:hypothetical protein